MKRAMIQERGSDVHLRRGLSGARRRQGKCAQDLQLQQHLQQQEQPKHKGPYPGGCHINGNRVAAVANFRQPVGQQDCTEEINDGKVTWEQVDQASAAYWADIRPPKHYDVEAAILQLFNRMFRRVLLAI